MRSEWIEIKIMAVVGERFESRSVRSEWIEIKCSGHIYTSIGKVSLRAERVD